ncbi:MAG: ABC transporter permease [Bacteriovoracaceae bacterium]
MSILLVLIKKELKTTFNSPLIYILTGLFSLIIGWAFFNLLLTYVESLQNLPENLVGTMNFVQQVIFRLFGNINFMLIFLCPLITMRLISEEKKQHSLEFLLTAPITNTQIILAKYFSALLMVTFVLSSSFIFPIIINTTGIHAGAYLLSGFLGIFLTAASFTAIGLLASSVTENQIVAALLSIVMILFLWMISWASQSTSNFYLVDLYRYLGFIDHFESFVRGLLKTTDFLYFFTVIFLSLLTSIKVLASRNW